MNYDGIFCFIGSINRSTSTTLRRLLLSNNDGNNSNFLLLEMISNHTANYLPTEIGFIFEQARLFDDF